MEYLLILDGKIPQNSFSEYTLQIETIVHPLNVVTRVYKLLTIGHCKVHPLVFMGPSCQVSQNLRLAAAPFSPQECSTVEALEHALVQTDPTNILRTPVMVALLVVGSQVQLVVEGIVSLLLREGQMLLLERKCKQSYMLNNFCKVMHNYIFVGENFHNFRHQHLNNNASSHWVT